MALSANGQRIENADSVELNSGGTGNPSLETGTDDPTSIGLAAAEGSIYMRNIPAAGEVYVKTGVGATAWTKAVVGSASVSLDQAYDTGRVVTADLGPIEINNSVADTTACLKMQRIPGAAAAATAVDIDCGPNATGVAVNVLVQNVGAKAVEITNSTAPTGSHIDFSTAGLGAGGKVLRVATSAAGDATGRGLSIEMHSGHAGPALYINHPGSGKAIVADNDVSITGDTDITGTLKMIGAQFTSVINLSDGASIPTNAASGNVFQVTLGGNRTLANPTNLDHGTYIWIIVQDGAGNRTLAYDTLFAFPGGITPVLSTAAGSVDILTAIYNGTSLLTTFQADFQ